MNEYGVARREIAEAVRQELEGPGAGPSANDVEHEAIDENPLERYAVGILFPRKRRATGESDVVDENTAPPSYQGRRTAVDETIDAQVNLTNQYYPSALGLSFFARGASPALTVAVRAAIYARVENLWRRSPVCADVVLPAGLEGMVTTHVADGLDLVAMARRYESEDTTFYTVTVVNTYASERQRDNERAFFQVGLRVGSSQPGTPVIAEYRQPLGLADDEESRSYELLYRERKTYAVGHGCAAAWTSADGGCSTEVFTEHLPHYDVPSLSFEFPPGVAAPDVRMSSLAGDGVEVAGVIAGLRQFCALYEQWIQNRRTESTSLPKTLRDTAAMHCSKCEIALSKMRCSVELLETDGTVRTAFMLANRAMGMQRLRSELHRDGRYPEEGDFPEPREDADLAPSWRPFQLGFILSCLESVANSASPDRDTVDILWFTTAAGKTEAYLGLTAFAVFLRRMRNPTHGHGTSVIMRYTLRLLTAQQFQRASSLVCACEWIRCHGADFGVSLGSAPITIGLWIGSESTPNTTQDALDSCDRLYLGTQTEWPFQLLNCPWCGARLTKGPGGQGRWGCRRGDRPRRLILFCPDSRCPFHAELPVKVVDEDIYGASPDLLFGTVDKFAMLPWKSDSGQLFGCDHDDRPAPELIIQDELHLISGPLGSIVGLYEAGIDILCTAKGIKPKIVASTATIRRAAEQCQMLYGRRIRQFPPSGIDAGDTFFAREVSIHEKPGRRYYGIMSTGKTLTTTEIRLAAALLHAVENVSCSAAVKDAYWTLVAYFNSLRELGHAATMVNDDIQAHIDNIARRCSTRGRELPEPDELTSRIPHQSIPEVLAKLFVGYPSDGAAGVLLASNMLATGVDVDRLNLMMIVGQPKTSAEYIQASSRVGRRYPGIVFALYSGTKPRDRSHFEHFFSYHQAFHRYVEPTSVTPFSGPARDRALHAVLIAVARHLNGLTLDRDAARLTEACALDCARRINGRVTATDGLSRADTAADLKNLIDIWLALAALPVGLRFGHLGQFGGRGPALMYPAGKKPPRDAQWHTLTSMRDVDADCIVRVVPTGEDA